MLKQRQRLVEQVDEHEDALPRVGRLQILLRIDTHVYEFGPFRLDAAGRRLTKGGEVIPLPSKTFDSLLSLAQNSGHLLEKDEIVRELWPDSEVEENNLTVLMSHTRKARSRCAGVEGYNETVPKRGYRFTA